MKNIKFSVKFTIAFGVVILLMVGIAIWSMSGISGIIKNSEEVIAGNKLRANFEEKIVQHLEWSAQVIDYLTNSKVNELQAQADDHKCGLGQWYYSDERNRAEELIPELKPLFASLEKPHESLHSSVIALNEILKEGKTNASTEEMEAAMDLYHNRISSNLENVRSILESAKEVVNENVMTDEVMISKAKQTKLAVIILSIVAGIIAILFAVLISRGIVNPIRKAILGMQRIAEGDMDVDLSINQRDEIGELVEAQREMIKALRESVDLAQRISEGDLTVTINKRSDKDTFMQALADMTEKLREVVSEVIGATNNFVIGSEQVSSTASQIAGGASEQASSTEEISSAMEEMAASIEQNSLNAQETEKISKKANEGVTRGQSAFERTLNAMKAITNKISVIGEIANRTDLLALNAAVEAARAGEHGKGFAVVAAEVRKLAERSQEAAKEINELSGASISDAEESYKIFTEIAPDIERTASLVQEISASSIEQNSGSQQVNSSLQQLTTVTQQNSTVSEELSSASEELASQAQMLIELVNYFHIEDNRLNKIRKTKKTTNKEVRPTTKKALSDNDGINMELTENTESDSKFESMS
jgi:methyl-accepting chemotaxis protein